MHPRLAALLEPDAERQLPAERLQTALDLPEFAAELIRGRHRLEHPNASAEEIEVAVEAWWAEKLHEPVPDWARVVAWPRSQATSNGARTRRSTPSTAGTP